jgi:hypothetical protein
MSKGHKPGENGRIWGMGGRIACDSLEGLKASLQKALGGKKSYVAKIGLTDPDYHSRFTSSKRGGRIHLAGEK